MKIYSDKFTVVLSNGEIKLPRKEFQLFELLYRNKGKAVGKLDIEDHIYDEGFLVPKNVVNTMVCSIRKKFRSYVGKDLIVTVPTFGYYMKEQK